LLFLLMCREGLAQTSNGTIAGTVVDATGAGVPQAVVTAHGVRTGFERKTKANGSGGFRLESMLLDTYTVTAEAPGFSQRRITNVLVNASIVTAVNPVLVAGSVNETVQVEAASELLQTETGEISATLGTEAVENLPIRTLSPYELAVTLPGVSVPPTNFLNPGFPNGFQFSVNGGRPRANNYLIEGQDNNDLGLHGQAIPGENLEAYHDVTFLLNAYQAEFGHGGASVSNLILKSGTNQFHGGIYYRLENSSLDAMDKGDLLNGSTQKSKYRENLAGFSVGGPALKDKLFFFVSYQFDHYRSTANLNMLTLPTAAGVATLQALPANPRIAEYLQAIGGLRGQSNAVQTANIPLGIAPGTTVDRGNMQVGPFRRNLNNANDSSELDIKSDYVIRAQDRLQIHYIRAPSLAPYNTASALLPGFDTEIEGVGHNAGIVETHIFAPNLLNEFRISFGRIGDTFDLRPDTVANPLGTAPTTTPGELTGYGAPSGYPQSRFHNTYQIQNSLSWMRGRHSVKVGFDLQIVQVRDQIPFNIFGSLNYQSSLTAVPASGGNPARTVNYSGFANYIDDFGGANGLVSQNFGNPITRPMFYFQNYYVQDTWKISPEFSLDFGLRYEYSGTPFNNIPYLGVTPATVSDFGAKVPQQADKNDWGPRFGFAYIPGFLGDKKTVLRGGFGIFYDGLFTDIQDTLLAFAPNTATPSVTSNATIITPRGQSGFSGLFPGLSRTASAFDSAYYITPHLLSPETLQWNLNVERELPGGFTGQVGYVGTRGEHLYASTEFNPYLNNFVSPARLFNSRGRVIRADNTADSVYHALQVGVVRKYRHGFQFRASYTYSRAEDDSSEIFTTGTYSTFATVQFPAPRKATEWGLSAFDRRNRLALSYVYELPKWETAPRVVGAIVNGWQVSGVTQFQSGSPGNVEIGYDWNGDGLANERPQLANAKAPVAAYAVHGDDPILFGGAPGTYCDGAYALTTNDPCHPVAAGSFHWLLPFFTTTGNQIGRNSFLTGGFSQWDISPQKSFKTWKEQSLDFRAEMFNVFNHGNTGVPNLNLMTGVPVPGAGTVTFGNNALTVTGHRSIRIFVKYVF
jgi:Carboxypeptidase regulatory-like domain